MTPARVLRSAPVLAIAIAFAACSSAPKTAPEPRPAAAKMTDRDGPQGEGAKRGRADRSDQTGTNPVNLQDSFLFFNELQVLRHGDFRNVENLRYIRTFEDQTMAGRVTLPVVATDANVTNDQVGIGDLNLRFDYVAVHNAKQGLMLGGELTLDTATDNVLGRGKYSLAPVITAVVYLEQGILFAPSYQHRFSVAGQEHRADINEGYLDLTVVMTTKDKRQWIALDPTFIWDLENEKSWTQLAVEVGHVLGPAFGGSGSIYVRPGFAVGSDRPYEWNIEVGFKLIGF